MICEQCKKNVGKELRRRVAIVNDALYTASLNKYFDTLGAAVRVVNEALLSQDFDVSRTDIRQMCEGEYRIHAEVGEGKYVTACFHRMPSGRFELVAYVS